MTITITKAPSFLPAQPVSFVGGEGIVRSLKPEADTWTYLVEMILGPKPDFGRVGGETMVLLTEEELRAV